MVNGEGVWGEIKGMTDPGEEDGLVAGSRNGARGGYFFFVSTSAWCPS
jgi:hypothetical protein